MTNNADEDFVGSAVTVDSLKLYVKNPNQISDQIFLVNKERFFIHFAKKDLDVHSTNVLTTLNYKQDHIIILEKFNDASDTSDFQEYKVLTKNGVGFLMLNKAHEFFNLVF